MCVRACGRERGYGGGGWEGGGLREGEREREQSKVTDSCLPGSCSTGVWREGVAWCACFLGGWLCVKLCKTTLKMVNFLPASSRVSVPGMLALRTERESKSYLLKLQPAQQHAQKENTLARTQWAPEKSVAEHMLQQDTTLQHSQQRMSLHDPQIFA